MFNFLRSQWAELGNEISKRLTVEFGNDGFGVSLRLKNLETIRTKLLRTMAIFENYAIKIIDRREFPSFGYRAVHVEVRQGLYLGEIQIRTPLQHEWAGSMESLAHLIGRDVRYGGEAVVDTYSPVVRNLLLNSYRGLVEIG